MEESILSLTKLNEMSGGDQQFINQMLTLFCETSIETLDKMHNSLETEDTTSFGKGAHKIKFSIDLIADQEMQHLVRELELAPTLEIKLINEKFKTLKQGVHKLIELIKSEYL